MYNFNDDNDYSLVFSLYLYVYSAYSLYNEILDANSFFTEYFILWMINISVSLNIELQKIQ